jgi:hypothetical protein
VIVRRAEGVHVLDHRPVRIVVSLFGPEDDLKIGVHDMDPVLDSVSSFGFVNEKERM